MVGGSSCQINNNIFFQLTLPTDPISVPFGRISPQVGSGLIATLNRNFSAKIFTYFWDNKIRGFQWEIK
jgi:hypothetical protein